jgi:thioredoxin 1
VRALLDRNPAYRAVTIMRVDWETYRDADIVRDLRIPRRSTLVVFKDGEEVARIVAQTAESAIEALFEAVL